MKYLGNAVLSRWHSVRGRHQKAIERWKRAMQVSTAVVTKIEDGIRLADLYTRADQPEEALAAWRNILPLFEVVDEKKGPLDVLRSVFSGRSATRRFDPFNLGSQQTTQARNTISVYKNSQLAKKRALAKTYNEEGAAERIFAITEAARRVTARHVLKNPLVEIPVGVIGGNTLITLRSRHPDLSVDSKLSGSYRKELPEDAKRFAHYVASNLVWFQVEMSRRVITRRNEKGRLEHLLDCFGVTIPLEVLDYEKKIVGGAFLGRETDKCYRLKVPSSDETVRTLYQAIEGKILQHVRSLQQQSDCLIHGDLTKRNILMDGLLIDLEKVCIGHPLVDLACLAVDLNSHQTENELLYQYCTETPQELQHKISHHAYEQARLYASLGLAGTTLAKGKKREARQFLRWTREALNALGDEETSRS
ncbi:MAG: phosphotransferase, partial [Patescibacteria group bacterium]